MRMWRCARNVRSIACLRSSQTQIAQPPKAESMARTIDNIIEARGALILGAGVAGLFTALKLAPFPALVLAGTRPGVSGSSAWAQGGIAAAVDPADTWQAHAHDTIAAGAGLCDPEIAA